jgi:RNA 2',3'-cyclic 3'-phosphodiesterase
MRSFLSYDIDNLVIREKIAHLQGELRKTGADLKLVDPGILHFTIRFLGEIDEEDKQAIIHTLAGKVGGLEQEVHFRGIGTFPNDRRISVVWIGIDAESASKLRDHSKTVNTLLETIPGLSKASPSEEFSPHVTIARVRTGRNKEKLVQAINEHRSDDFGGTSIKNLRLKLSVLTPSGPEYSDLHVFES